MAQEPDHNKAMDMLNGSLREMKGELNEVDALSLKKENKSMAKRMHKIYDELEELVEQYEKTHSHDDLNHVFKQMELLKPAFVLNSNEILKHR